MRRLSLYFLLFLAVLPLGVRYTVLPFVPDDAVVENAVFTFSKRYASSVERTLHDAWDTTCSTVHGFLSVREVRISGTKLIPSEKLLETNKLQGTWLWQIDEVSIAQEIKRHPWIEKANVSLQGFPTELHIGVTEKTPRAVAELNGSSWLVAESGALIQELNSLEDPDLIEVSLELPRLSGFSSLDRSDRNSKDLGVSFPYLVSFVAALQEAGGLPFKVERFELREGGTIVAIPYEISSYPQIYFAFLDDTDSPRELLTRLDLVLADLEARGEVAREVDLRFRNQAILR